MKNDYWNDLIEGYKKQKDYSEIGNWLITIMLALFFIWLFVK